jgi:hypothetical protein
MSGEKDEPSSKHRYALTKSGVSVRIVPPVELNTESKANVLRIMKWEDDSAEQVMGSRVER